jgi:ribose transport system substrate-binding protein
MKVGGEIYGGFSESLAKQETLKYLATHPAKVDAVASLAGMGSGVLQAFKQSGRPVPLIAELGLDQGVLGYWRQNQGAYHAASAGLPPTAAARAIYEVAVRTLRGQGPRLNHLIGEVPLVTDANLAQWAQPGWGLQTVGTAPGLPQSFLPSSYLDAFFTRPAALTQ